MMLIFRRSKTKNRTEAEEEQFILAVNSLKTLRAPPGGCMSIDPEEIREVIIAIRELYKDFAGKGEN